MFWGLTFICQEYCVPAITVFCHRNKISNNVTGSLFIGAGLSLPVLFSSYVGLFGSNTGIGLGAVLGGNIFNQTINIAGSILVAPNRRLKLCRVSLTREMLIYALSNILIILAVEQDLYRSFQNVLDVSVWTGCLSVPINYSIMLVICYIIYCVVVVYSGTIARLPRQIKCLTQRCLTQRCSGITDGSDPCTERDDGSDTNHPPNNNNNNNNNNSNNNPDKQHFTQVSPRLFPSGVGVTQEISTLSSKESYNIPRINVPRVNITLSPDAFFSTDGPCPCPESGMIDEQNHTVCDFTLVKKSEYYNIFSESLWMTRYCSLHDGGFMSYRNREDLPAYGCHTRYVDLHNPDGIVISNPEMFEFTIIANYPDKRTFRFRAPDLVTFIAVTERLKEITASISGKSPSDLKKIAEDAM